MLFFPKGRTAHQEKTTAPFPLLFILFEFLSFDYISVFFLLLGFDVLKQERTDLEKESPQACLK